MSNVGDKSGHGSPQPSVNLLVKAIDWLFEQPEALEYDRIHGHKLLEGRDAAKSDTVAHSED